MAKDCCSLFISLPSLQALLKYKYQIKLYVFKSIQCDYLIHVHVVKWLPQSGWLTHPLPHIVGMLMICPLNKCQVYSTVLWTVITMLYIRSPGLNWKLKVCTLWPTSPRFPYSLAPGNHRFILCFCELSLTFLSFFLFFSFYIYK